LNERYACISIKHNKTHREKKRKQLVLPFVELTFQSRKYANCCCSNGLLYFMCPSLYTSRQLW